VASDVDMASVSRVCVTARDAIIVTNSADIHCKRGMIRSVPSTVV